MFGFFFQIDLFYLKMTEIQKYVFIFLDTLHCVPYIIIFYCLKGHSSWRYVSHTWQQHKMAFFSFLFTRKALRQNLQLHHYNGNS